MKSGKYQSLVFHNGIQSVGDVNHLFNFFDNARFLSQLDSSGFFSTSCQQYKPMRKNKRPNKLKQYWNNFRDWREQVRKHQRIGNTKRDHTMEVTEICTCQNCGHTFQGRHCSNCGQAADTKRITMKSALHNLVVTLIGGDSVFLRTCGNLLYRPGHLVRDFLCGKRTRYFRPVQMLLCLVTIYALLSLIFKDGLSMSNIEFENEIENGTFAQASQMLMKFLSNTVAFSLVFAFVSVFPYKLLFRRCSITWPDGVQRRLNTAEHFFTLIYLSCLFILMEFVLLPLDWIPFTKDWAASLGLFVPILLSTWLYKQLYEISWWKSIWRNVLAAILTLSTIIFLLILYFGIYYGVAEVMK